MTHINGNRPLSKVLDRRKHTRGKTGKGTPRPVLDARTDIAARLDDLREERMHEGSLNRDDETIAETVLRCYGIPSARARDLFATYGAKTNVVLLDTLSNADDRTEALYKLVRLARGSEPAYTASPQPAEAEPEEDEEALDEALHYHSPFADLFPAAESKGELRFPFSFSDKDIEDVVVTGEHNALPIYRSSRRTPPQTRVGETLPTGYESDHLPEHFIEMQNRLES